MTGQNVPYHLRINKFIERQLFLDVLDAARVWNGPSQYVYVAMGGRFLEDFKLVNDRFAIEHMFSIESDRITCDRQAFNRLGFIDCRHQTTGEFIDDLDVFVSRHKGRRLIVWLDYTMANKRGMQLSELRQLVSKLASGDVVKITLNANSQSFRRRAAVITRNDFDKYLRKTDDPIYKDFETYLGTVVAAATEQSEEGAMRSLALSDPEYETICIENLKEQLGDYVPPGGIQPEHLQPGRFASFLADCVKTAMLKGVEGSHLQVVPLACYRYRDGEHQMLTATAILASDRLAKIVKADRMFKKWPFRSADWDVVHEVNVPDMSTKEQNHIDGQLTARHRVETIHRRLPFRLHSKDDESLALLREYVRHYRRYPTFRRVQ